MGDSAALPPTFVFDGDCGFCSSSARLLRRLGPGPARVEAWQRLDLAALGLTEAECDESVQWVAPHVHSRGPLAIADYLAVSRRPVARAAGRLLGLGPVQWVARPVYAWVSRHRHQLPGGTPACRLDR